MRVADILIEFLVQKGVNTIFLVTGGQAMFLNDALARNNKIKPIFTHHEQAAGMAAEAYGRISGKPGVAMVTAGPGAVNIMNGVVGAWTDSSPMLVISGQSAYSNVEYQKKTGIRQYGVQGINIEPLVKHVTKYFKTIDNPKDALYFIQKAWHIASQERPGPVWIDVPLDIQSQEINFEKTKHFFPKKVNLKPYNLDITVKNIFHLLQNSKRPLLLIGHGVRISRAQQELHELISILKIPVVTSRLGIDIIHSTHPLFIGRPGTYGERSANFAIQNADLIISIGCRMATAMIGYNAKDFGRNAKIVVIDIDRKEIDKPGPIIYKKIKCDAKIFLNALISTSKNAPVPNYSKWIMKCQNWRKKYPVVLGIYKREKPINSYFFTKKLSKLASATDVIVVDTGGCFHIVSQSWKIKKDQRFVTTGGISSMGYWVAGMGACLGMDKKQTIIITGDGSLQMNIQELATVKQNNFPLKIFVFNNNGYLLIRHTQKNFMEGRLFGEGPKSGLFIPDSLKIARAYGIKGVRIKNINEIDKKLKEVLEFNGPVICDVITPEWQQIIPRTASEKTHDGRLIAKPYEDMFPFLNREELNENMIAEKKSYTIEKVVWSGDE